MGIIPNNSLHPLQHKLAAYLSIIHILTNTPLSTVDFNKELNIIKQIAVNNGYPPTTIDNILNAKLWKKAISEVDKSNTLTYIGKPSTKIKTFLNKQNINIAFKTNKKIKNNKTKINKNNTSGFYQLSCGCCEKIYIGQTGRSFKTRISEHKRSFLKQKTDSTYSNHL